MNGKCYLIFTFLIIKITTSSVACSFINHRSYFYFDCDQRIAAVQLNDLVVKECPELGIAEHVEEKSVAGDPYFVVEKLVLVRLELAPELEQLVPVPALVHEQLELAPVLGQLVLAAFVVDFEAVVAPISADLGQHFAQVFVEGQDVVLVVAPTFGEVLSQMQPLVPAPVAGYI